MNGTITKVVFPHADELGSVPVLPATAPRGWEHEPVSEESEGVIAPDPTLPSSIDAESSHAYIWEHAAAQQPRSCVRSGMRAKRARGRW